MVDELGIIIGSVIAGLAGGFLSSWMAFNASGEEFDRRKHGNGLITGAIAGMAAGIAFALALPEDATTAQIAVSLFATFFATVGIDRIRSSGSKMISREQFDKITSAIKGETTPPPPPPPPPAAPPG